jgi:hypothetical protein
MAALIDAIVELFQWNKCVKSQRAMKINFILAILFAFCPAAANNKTAY